jgi:small-conductance mechanosensitive channel
VNFAIDWNIWANKVLGIGQTLLIGLAFWLLGGWLIRLAVKLTQRAMASQKVDRTIIGWVGSSMTITLKILLVVGILGYMGFETTSFAALLAAIGLAIGAAWSGLLANMAAGAFLLILRPLLKERISEIPNVLPVPEPEIGIEKFTPMGPVLAVKPCCDPRHCGQVQYNTNRVIKEAFGDAGFQVPKQHLVVQNSR